MNPNFDTQRVSQALDKLFRTYQSFDRGADPEEIARNRLETAKVYFEAVESYDTRDIETAVRAFLSGTVPGHNPAFAPTAPQVGGAARIAMERRLEAEHRERLRRPQLPAPDIEHSPESRARVKAMVDQTISNLAEMLRTDDAEADRRRKERVQRSFERFDPDPSPEATKRRLGFAIGDPDSEHDAA